MDVFLLNFVGLIWTSVAIARHPFAAGKVPRLLVLTLVTAWLLLAGVWIGEILPLMRFPLTSPPLRPVISVSPLPEILPAAPPVPIGLQFNANLIAATGTTDLTVEGLLSAVSPSPGLNLPRLRGAPSPVVRIIIPAQPGISRLRVSFSVRLHQRNRAGLAVFLNGKSVRQFRLGSATAWLDEIVDLVSQAGSNVIEFQDTALHNEPDWLEYLERYPDVRHNLVSLNIPLEAGAQAHYEAAGRSEGRTVRFLDTLPPEADSYYFLFRQLRVEGFRTP